MNCWISVKDELPKLGQAILFVNDIGANQHDKRMHNLMRRGEPLIEVRAGFVYEARDDGLGNYIQTGPIPEYHTVVGHNGSGDHITYWQPFPEPPIK